MNTLPIEKRYRPSSGSEDDAFMVDFCWDCVYNEACDILYHSAKFQIHEDEYPEEWTFDEDGNRTCTAFKHD